MEYTEAQQRAVNKYSHDGPFMDPVVRCDACSTLILTADLKKHGMCECSNKRIRNLLAVNEKDKETIKNWISEGKVDPDFLLIFEA